ncbi:hypothetical protein IW138_000755 [Coemansia sp. RSA 986]|nr:hypothetical protein IW138_000755 [Coemansia sp. RSA 986]
MAPSELIDVREFRDKYASLVRSQKDHGLFNAQSEWSKEAKDEVANRCRIDDDLCFSNTAFVNPTLFHMLRQHREFNEATERELLQKKREEAAELEKRRRTKTAVEHGPISSSEGFLQNNGTAAESTQIGFEGVVDSGGYGDSTGERAVDSSMLLSVDVDGDGVGNELDSQAMNIDATTVEDALARLANGSSTIVNAVSDKVEQGEKIRSDTGNANSNGAQAQEEHQKDESFNKNGSQVAGDEDKKEKDGVHIPANKSSGSKRRDQNNIRATDKTYSDGSGSNSDDSAMSDSSLDGEDGNADNNSSFSASNSQPAPVTFVSKSRARKPEEITLFTPVSELPTGITQEMLRQAIANSGFARSTDVAAETKHVVKQRTRIEEPAGVSELECKFRKVKDLLDESTLASLRKANRRMVPPKYRLEVNFLTNRVQPGTIPNATPVADDEVLLSVCFYNTRSSTSKMEEYLVLGSQNLTVLRDSFYCISDFLFSHRDEQIENTKDKKVSSSYFFIEKTFYNDMRSPTATDYSRVIMEWANDPARQAKNPKLQGLQSRLMDGARFLDLSIRLKQPYLFVHQGDCEHVMMFTDLRLLGPKDDQFVENYPKQIFRTRHMRHKCRMCSAYPAQYVTKNDFHSGMSPCYFCEKCYTPFHFDDDGKKLLEHDVFPYANVNLM